MIDIPPTDSVENAAGRIPLQPDSILVLLGSFDASIALQMRSLCARAIAPVALLVNALVVTDGVNEGPAAQMGQAVRQLDQAPSLLGILDATTATPEPNHPNLVRLPVEWGDPPKRRLLIVAALAKSQEAAAKPVVLILIGGNDDDKITLQRFARRGWPILIVQGAGGLGDAILTAQARTPEQVAANPILDPDLNEILDTANICPLSLNGSVDDLKRQLLSPLQQPGDVLACAWRSYDDLDLAAVGKQRRFRRIQISILSFAVLAALLAVAVSGKALPPFMTQWIHAQFPAWLIRGLQETLRIMLILVPITISVLNNLNSRFREGNKWILLRAAAEAVKREIFRYRMRSGVYAVEQCGQASASSKLASKVQDITSNLIQTEVNHTSLPHQFIEDPKRQTFLRPEDYLPQRIQNQMEFFVDKTKGLYRGLKQKQLWILIAGGMGTFLAAINFGVWVAVTTGIATALTTKLEIDQVDNTIVQYNVALTNLRNIESWWAALSPWEKTRQRNIDLLVDQTEKSLEKETSGWAQQMQSELDKLTEKQPDTSQKPPASAQN